MRQTIVLILFLVELVFSSWSIHSREIHSPQKGNLEKCGASTSARRESNIWLMSQLNQINKRYYISQDSVKNC